MLKKNEKSKNMKRGFYTKSKCIYNYIERKLICHSLKVTYTKIKRTILQKIFNSKI